jgi:hypothetical protein
MTKPKKTRPYPYFKVQARDRRSLAWKDHRHEAFATLDDALKFCASLDPMEVTRVVRWDENGSAPVDTER